jgi:hypothetical protein
MQQAQAQQKMAHGGQVHAQKLSHAERAFQQPKPAAKSPGN